MCWKEIKINHSEEPVKLSLDQCQIEVLLFLFGKTRMSQIPAQKLEERGTFNLSWPLRLSCISLSHTLAKQTGNQRSNKVDTVYSPWDEGSVVPN